MLYRDRHWTDIAKASGVRSRRIGTHLNYKGDGGLFMPTRPRGVAQGAPSNWIGQWDFRDHSGESPLQFSAHDTTDPDNRAMVGLRVDDDPDVWVNIKMTDVVAGVETQRPSETVWEWPGLWTNAKLRWTHGGNIALKELELSGPGHPNSFDMLVRKSPGSTLEDDGAGGLLVKGPQGVTKFRLRAPYGHDANEAYIRCTMVYLGAEGPGGIYHRYRLTPNADDMAAAVYPVVIDPTSSIDSTGMVDNWLRGDANTLNYGVRVNGQVIYIPTTIYRNVIHRVDETLIPAGTLTTARLLWTAAATDTSPADVIEAYKIAVANYGWNEGTANGTAQTGSSCARDLSYDASTPTAWAGSDNLRTSGTDYVADASPPSSTGLFTINTQYTMTLGATGASWFTDWRDTPANNAGIVIHPNAALQIAIHMREATTAAYRPVYEIDYAAATGQPTWIRWTPTHVAGRNNLIRGNF